MEITTQNRADTLALGERLGRYLIPGDIVLLFGDLGSGKTTLTQGICQGLGLGRGEYIRSPSFTLINEYKGKYPIYHIDLYRLETFAEIESLGLEEPLFGTGVAIVEWAEKLFHSPENRDSIGFGITTRIEVRIEITGENDRIFDVRPIYLKNRDLPVLTLQ